MKLKKPVRPERVDHAQDHLRAYSPKGDAFAKKVPLLKPKSRKSTPELKLPKEGHKWMKGKKSPKGRKA